MFNYILQDLERIIGTISWDIVTPPQAIIAVGVVVVMGLVLRWRRWYNNRPLKVILAGIEKKEEERKRVVVEKRARPRKRKPWLHRKTSEKQETPDEPPARVEHYAHICEHTTYLVDTVSAYGSKKEVTLDPEHLAYCHRCLEGMAIPCAWCGKAIFIDDDVTLYECQKNDLPPYQEGMKSYHSTDTTITLVGCTRLSCNDTGADAVARWVTTQDNKGRVLLYDDESSSGLLL